MGELSGSRPRLGGQTVSRSDIGTYQELFLCLQGPLHCVVRVVEAQHKRIALQDRQAGSEGRPGRIVTCLRATAAAPTHCLYNLVAQLSATGVRNSDVAVPQERRTGPKSQRTSVADS